MIAYPLMTSVIVCGSFGVTCDLGNYFINSKKNITQTIIGLVAGAAIGLVALQFGKDAAIGASILHTFTHIFFMQRNSEGKLSQIHFHISAILIGTMTHLPNISLSQRFLTYAFCGVFGWTIGEKWNSEI